MPPGIAAAFAGLAAIVGRRATAARGPLLAHGVGASRGTGRPVIRSDAGTPPEGNTAWALDLRA